MDKKVDWNSLFDLPEGSIQPRSVALDSKEEVQKKNPYVMSQEVCELMGEVTKHVMNEDVNSVIRALDAANLRIELMLEVANRMKDLLDRRKGG
jgi:hypothetical protein